MRTSDVVLEELDVRSLDDATIDEVNAFHNVMLAESHPEDPPTSNEQARIGYRNIPEFVVAREFVVRDAKGAIVGWTSASWEDEATNRHLLGIEPRVHPAHRRRGIGTMLVEKGVEAAEAAGKRLLVSHTFDRVPSGEAFARRIGAEAAMIGHTNRLALAEVDRAMVERWVAEGPGRAAGYSLVTIDGPAPEDLIEKVVDVLHVMNTAPTEDLDIEDQSWTVETMRGMEKAMFAGGSQRRYIAARHDASGEFVGFTEMWRNPNRTPGTAWQWGTGVRPEHRGFALGKWLKAVNVLRILDEWPDVVDIRTHNADSNDAMLGINHALGFKPYTIDINWQISVDKARDYVRSA